MECSSDIIHFLAEIFELPIINDDAQVWFFRTESGLYSLNQ